MSTNMGARAAGDRDDDLDFDPFKETQKALAEMIESEMMQHSVTGFVFLFVYCLWHFQTTCYAHLY